MATRKTSYLVVRPLAGGGYGYYWTPSPALRKAGWEDVNFGMSATDSDDARYKLAEARNELVRQWRTGGAKPRQVKAIVQRHTIGDAIDRFLDHCRARVAEKAKPVAQRNPLVGKPMAKNTLDGYVSKCKTIRIWGTTAARQAQSPPPGDIPVASITHDNVLLFRNALMTPDPETGHIAHQTAHQTLRVLRTMLAFAEREGMIPKGSNPAEDFELAVPPSRTRQWDEDGGTDDFDTFLRACDFLGCPSIGLGVEIAAWTSQRQADILKLTVAHWKTIRLNDQALLDALRGDDPELKGFILTQNKTDRPVGIPIVQPLRARIEAAIARNLALNPPQLAILIDEESGRPLDRFAFSKKVKMVRDFCADPTPDAIRAGILPRPGLKDLWFMDLRRTRVCWLADRGLEDQQIAMITGHSIKTVQQILESTYRPRTTRGAAVALLAAHGASPRKGDVQKELKA